MVLNYANPCNPSGILSAIQQALFPSLAVNTTTATKMPPAERPNQDFGSGGRARQLVDSRFISVDGAGRDALRIFLGRQQHTGAQVMDEHLELLKGLPIFRVHKNGSDTGEWSEAHQRRRRAGNARSEFTSISGTQRLFLAPKNSDPALLGPDFAVEKNGDAELLESLGVERVGKGAFFREHVLPRAVDQDLPIRKWYLNGEGGRKRECGTV